MAPGSVLGPELQLSRKSTFAGEDWFAPAAAYNPHRGSHIVFTHVHSDTGGDIYGYYWSRMPNDGTWFWLMAGVQPAVAYNAADDDFFVAAMHDSDEDGRYEIWGYILQGNSDLKIGPFLIFQWANRSFWSPRVAWNSRRNEYLVVWHAVDTTTGLPNDVAAARVSAGGTVLPGAPRLITAEGRPHSADVTYNPAMDEYLVVWTKIGTGMDGNIWGALLRGSHLAFIAPGPFPVSAEPEDQRSPAVTTNGWDSYMVAWEHAYPGPCCDWDMRGQEYDMLGMPVGVEIRISQSADDETNVRVAARPGKKRDFMAVWQKETTIGTEIWAERWGDVQVPYEYFQVASAAWWAHTRPEVMIAGPRYYFVYEADSLGDPTVFRHIFARGWTANVTYVPLLLR